MYDYIEIKVFVTSIYMCYYFPTFMEEVNGRI